jgi:hypothetical protein
VKEKERARRGKLKQTMKRGRNPTAQSWKAEVEKPIRRVTI